jgi:hypothetical protein
MGHAGADDHQVLMSIILLLGVRIELLFLIICFLRDGRSHAQPETESATLIL